VLAAAVAGCGGGGGGTAPAGDGAEAAAGNTVCDSVGAPAPSDRSGEPPAGKLPEGATYTLTFTTNCGTFVVALDRTLAPNTVGSLVSLARAGYFDETLFHRIVPGFVIQGGDPSQTGSGGPGYKTVDRPPPDAEYVKGVVAMAKTGAEAPGTSGSQFFVVTAENAGLPADYAIVGEVTGGLDVIDKIGQLGDQFEQPTEPVVISSVTVAEQ
jgi:cyclophilin family peptidyl-prolyl cis-trans isomerase